MAIRLLSIVLLVLFASTASAQQIFKWKDKKGQWHFSDTPPPGVTAKKVKGLDISPKSSPATFPYAKPEQSQPVSSPRKIMVPFTGGANRVIVKGIVNGRGTVKFLLDTGADTTSIPRGLAEQSGINGDRGIRIPHTGIGGTVWEPLVEIDSLKVGEAEVRNLDVIVMEKGVLDGETGLLGANFLAQFKFEIMYENNQLMLERRQGPYAGYPAEWWQKKFRKYYAIKRGYEKIRERTYVTMKAIMISRCKSKSARPAGGSLFYCNIEKGLRTIEERLRNLYNKARRAGVPRNFRK